MNCWIILLLLSCCGTNNGTQTGNIGGGCTCHNHCQNSCIQPRMRENDTCCERNERERDDTCPCTGSERVKEKWMPYTGCDENERRESRESYRGERNCDCKQY